MYEAISLTLFALGGALDGWRDFVMELVALDGDDTTCQFHLQRGYDDEVVVLSDYSQGNKYRIKWLWGLINIPLDKWHILKTCAYACFALGAFVAGTTAHPWLTALVGWVIVRPPFQNTVLFSLIYKTFKPRGW